MVVECVLATIVEVQVWRLLSFSPHFQQS